MSRFLRAASLGLLLNNTPESNVPAPAASGGGGGGRSSEKPEKPISQVVEGLIRRYGDANTALGVLAGEGRDYRIRHRKDQETIAALRAPGPKEGGLHLLSKEEAAELAAYRALGKPDEVKQKVEKVGTLEGEAAARAQADRIATMADAVAPGVKYKASVLTDLVRGKGLHIEERDVTEKNAQGQDVTVKRPHVRPASDATAALVPLHQWISTNAADYLPALTAAPAAGPQPQPNNGGVAMPVVPPSNQAGPAGDPVAARLARYDSAAKAGNALRPAPATTEPAKV